MELTMFKDYNEYHNEVRGVLNRTVEDFVYTGYLLKQGRDTDLSLIHISEPTRP